jgi:hypothetical protein
MRSIVYCLDVNIGMVEGGTHPSSRSMTKVWIEPYPPDDMALSFS